MNQFKKPILMKIVKDDYEVILVYMDEIFKLGDVSYKNHVKNSIKINKYSLIDIANKKLVASFHDMTDSIYLDYYYFKSNDTYYRMKEDIDGVELFQIQDGANILIWNTKSFKHRLDIIFNSVTVYLKHSDINIFWDDIPTWRSRKEKLEFFLLEENNN